MTALPVVFGYLGSISHTVSLLVWNKISPVNTKFLSIRWLSTTNLSPKMARNTMSPNLPTMDATSTDSTLKEPNGMKKTSCLMNKALKSFTLKCVSSTCSQWRLRILKPILNDATLAQCTEPRLDAVFWPLRVTPLTLSAIWNSRSQMNILLNTGPSVVWLAYHN